MELKTESTHKAEQIYFPPSKSEEKLMVKSEIQDDFHAIENNYLTALNAPGEVLVNDYDEFNHYEFDILETPVITNAEIRSNSLFL